MTISVQKTALCFLIHENKILLLKRRNTWYENEKYLPPGGNVDSDENPKITAIRELFEETGLKVEIDDLQLIWNYQNELNNIQWDNYYFLTQKFTGELTNMEPDRHSDIGWFELGNLPKDTSQVVYDTLKQI